MLKQTIFSLAFFVCCWNASGQLNEISAASQTNVGYTVQRIQLSTGVQLDYAERGNNEGDPVIFLHGITDSWQSFAAVMPYLPASIHAYALSVRGHGNSDKPSTGYTPVQFARDIDAFMNALNIKSAVIVGHSMGGSIAQRFVLDFPQRAKALVLIGSFASFRDKPEIADLNKLMSELKDPVDPAFIAEFQKSTLAKEIPAANFNTYVSESAKVPARVWVSAMTNLMSAEYSSEYKYIMVPTLIIWGDKDMIVPEADQDKLTTGIRNSRLLIYPNTGHAVHWEEPMQFANDLVSFIDKNL